MSDVIVINDDEHISSSDSGSDIDIVEISHHDRQSFQSSKSIGSTIDNSSPSHTPEIDGLKAMKCVVCLETPEVVAVAQCGHYFCRDCVFITLSSSRAADKKSGICSVCRQKVRYDQVLFLEMRMGEKRNPEKELEEELSRELESE